MFGLDVFGATLSDDSQMSRLPPIKPSFIRYSHGLVYRACDAIIHAIDSRRSLGIEAELFVSYVEIYGDTVSDLLRNGQRCGHSKTASHQYVLSGAAEREVHVMDDIVTFLKIGEEQKRRAATAMNDRSTRAHGLFILHLKQRDLHSDVTISSKLFLADLGGSEQVKKSQVEPGKSKTYPQLAPPLAAVGTDSQTQTSDEDPSTVTFSTGFELGDRMRETVYINLGLLALKKCIEALNNRQPYVPYQDSKLTMLLSAGLGNGKTSVIICSSSDCHHINETIATLRFGEKCSQIEMAIRNNVTVLESMLLNIDTEIKELEQLIIKKERWEVVEEKRHDELAEEGTVEAGQGGIEKRYVTVLCGAEEERNRLDELIRQRAELTGSDYIRRAYQTKVIAFGKKSSTYGKKYNPSEEMKMDNERFNEKADEASVPSVVRARGKEWKMGKELEVAPEILEKKAWTTKRNKAVYSGLS
jgi:kinesin family member 5